MSNWTEATQSHMELTLIRQPAVGDCLFGALSVNGVTECVTLEDRADVIPAGRYEVQVTFSQRFQTRLPILLDVPGRSGIRLHAGNFLCDTSGCILVGRVQMKDWLRDSVKALQHLLPQLAAAEAAGERIWIHMLDHEESLEA